MGVVGAGPVEIGAAHRADAGAVRPAEEPRTEVPVLLMIGETDLPVTEQVAESVLTPPLYSHMTEDQVRRVAISVRAIAESAGEVAVALQ